MIIIYAQRRNKSNLSVILNYINNNSSREFTYYYSGKYVDDEVDISIVIDRGLDKDDVQKLSLLVLNNHNAIHVSVEPNRIVPYRKGKEISISEFETFIKEM